jgi:hypothetical protein
MPPEIGWSKKAAIAAHAPMSASSPMRRPPGLTSDGMCEKELAEPYQTP